MAKRLRLQTSKAAAQSGFSHIHLLGCALLGAAFSYVWFGMREPIVIYQPAASVEQSSTAGDSSREELSADPAAYYKAQITNSYDYEIRIVLDEADKFILEGRLDVALEAFEALLRKHPQSPRLHFGRSVILERLSKQHDSAVIAERALEAYSNAFKVEDIPDALYIYGAERMAEMAMSRGYMEMAIHSERMAVNRCENCPDLLQLKKRLGSLHTKHRQFGEAKAVFEDVLRAEPDSGFAQVYYGAILQQVDDDLEGSVEYLSRGIASNQSGTQHATWYISLGDALIKLGRMEEANEVHKKGAELELFPSAMQRPGHFTKGLTARPWWNVEETGYAQYFRAIANDWEVIRREGLALLNSDASPFTPEDEKLSRGGDWSVFLLYTRGKRNDSNCLRAPTTCEILDRIPEATNCTQGGIKLSVLHPGAVVVPHCGPSNRRIRAHLGLQVPEGAHLRVAGETREWTEGDWLVLDDSFEHQVWHDGAVPRLILIVDFWHPDLTAEQRAALPASSLRDRHL